MSILSQQKQSVNTDFPNLRPSLDLRFALAKKLDPRITFTRASPATYFGPDGIMRTAGVNEPRFDHDPVTGQSLGLLVEESRTNLISNSNSFGSSGASYGIISNATISPDGTLNASKIFEQINGSYKIYFDSFTPTAGQTYCISVFVKAAERKTMYFKFAEGANYTNFAFNMITGVITGAGGSPSSPTNYGAINCGNGWWRIYLTYTFVGSSGSNAFQIFLRNDTSGSLLYQGDGSSGFYVYGKQAELGAFPTSYIPTSGSQVTRSADKPNIFDISSFFNSTEGTLLVDSEIPYQTNAKFPSIGFTRGSTAGSPNAINFYYYNTSTPYVTFLVRNTAAGGGFGGQLAHNLIEISSPNQTVGVYKKFVGTYKFGELNYYFDGKFVAKTNTNKALPTSLTYMEIGTNGNNDNRLNGHIRRITYYPIALTNQQLINLTS